MLEANLQLSVEERWAQHEPALELALALCEAGVALDLEKDALTAKDIRARAAKRAT